MNVKPLRDFVVVSKETVTETKTASGIVMVTHVEKVAKGTVLAVGSGLLATNGSVVPLEVQVGDQVAFNSNLATELKTDDGTTVLLLREEQLLAVIKK